MKDKKRKVKPFSNVYIFFLKVQKSICNKENYMSENIYFMVLNPILPAHF